MNLDLSFFIHIVPDKSRQISSKFKLRALSRLLTAEPSWLATAEQTQNRGLKILRKFWRNKKQNILSWLRYVVKYILQTLLLSKLKESVAVSTNYKLQMKVQVEDRTKLSSCFYLENSVKSKLIFLILRNCCMTNSIFRKLLT